MQLVCRVPSDVSHYTTKDSGSNELWNEALLNHIKIWGKLSFVIRPGGGGGGRFVMLHLLALLSIAVLHVASERKRRKM